MKKILILTTGGTISSVPSINGLIPTDANEYFKKIIRDPEVELEFEKIMVLDSSNIQPEEWKIIATDIYNNLNKYDGIIVTHGTDTMAYTASMMCFMIQHPSIPIVFTGSQLPLHHPLTDAYDNLNAALVMAKSGIRGIFIAFNRKIMIACRAVKVRSSDFDAFESINLRYIGKISATGLTIKQELVKHYDDEPILNTNIDTNVFLLKMTPTTNPNIIDLLIRSGIKGIVIEAYGAGGLSYERRDYVSKIDDCIKNNIPVVLTSQCLYDPSNFNIYEVGQRAIKTGAIEALDMTSEAAVCKLMYALGQTKSLDEIKRIFKTEIAQEIRTEAEKI